jgi:hypothetical protein
LRYWPSPSKTAQSFLCSFWSDIDPKARARSISNTGGGGNVGWALPGQAWGKVMQI